MTGYLHPQYAEALAEFGSPCPLPRSGGYLLARQIPNTEWQDAMGTYPLFCCQDWTRLHEDLEELRNRMVTVALVTDPLGNYDESLLRRFFDRVVKFKEHFIADLTQPVNELVPKYHRKHARRALRDVTVEVLSQPLEGLDDWDRLYAQLVARHEIKGLRAFSRTSFAAQLQVPGMVAFRVVAGTQAIGMHLWYVQGDAAYSHLSAYSDAGYDLRISYGLNWAANEYFSGRVRWLVLGAGPGTTTGDAGGLAEYKRGWSTGVRSVYFCGITLDAMRYEAISRSRGGPATEYFPAYRQGEF
jgi:hypothetical protein